MSGVGEEDGEVTLPIIEQTSSSEHHYELMALIGSFGGIAEDVHAIRAIMEQSFAITDTLRQEVQAVLDAHAQSAQEYIRQVEEPVPVDYHPFTSMPAGTTVRDLPDGGRLFSLTDGAFLRVFPDGSMSAIGEDGTPESVMPASGGKVTLPDGRELTLVSEAIKVTHEAAGIEGLPDGVEPVLASQGRYTVVLPDGTRIDVYRSDKAIAVVNTSGTIDVLGISRIYGIGEEVQSRSLSGGAKNFKASESRHAGMIEANGTIHLSLSGGLDLVIHFPVGPGSGDDGISGAVCFNCEELD
ncbi:MAG TPA: hypothetical protein PLP86_05510 [Armatimonadota bacterium]|nr:hypothetical protein [Armatimonadota bacterium]